MLLGIWKNVEELENCLNLSELEVIVSAARKRARDEQEFMAALQGIDISKSTVEEDQRRFEDVQRRAEARLSGKSEAAIELDAFGIDIEEE